MFRKFLKDALRFNWRFGLVMTVIFSLLRVYAVRFGIESGNNSGLSALFVLMIVLPALILNKNGRKRIGLVKTTKFFWILKALLLGIFVAILIGSLGILFFAKTGSNWYYYIGSTYTVDLAGLGGSDKAVYFVVFLIVGMTFSPLGEEFLYRGVIHSSFEGSFGRSVASIIDSAAFGMIHLVHFGLVYIGGTWKFLVLPGALWMIMMFLTGLLFNFCKLKSGSLWGAVVGHMGFNIGMTFFIFYILF